MLSCSGGSHLAGAANNVAPFQRDGAEGCPSCNFLVCVCARAPPSVTRVTSVLTHSSGELLLLGTEGGHVFIVEVPGFRELEEMNISLDQITSW